MDPKNIRASCGKWETGRPKEISNATEAALLANVRKDLTLNGREKSSEGFVKLVFLLPVLCAFRENMDCPV